MTGRHSSGRSDPRIAAPLPIMAGVLVLIVVAWFAFQYLADRLARHGCTNPVTVEVAAEPAIAPALADVAAAMQDRPGGPVDGCYQLQVVSQEAAAVADRLTGLEPGGQPDVWVPDSTFWLRRARAGGAIDLPADGASLASSPVVLAVAEPAATQLGWPDHALSWRDVLGASPSAAALNVGMADPARNPVGLATLFGVRAVTAVGPEPAAAQVAQLRRLSPNVVARAAELFERLPAAFDPGAAAGAGNGDGDGTGTPAVTAFPTTEQAVLRHNNTEPGQRLVPVYPPGGVPALDYPYVVLPTATGIQRTGAERFLESLLDRATQRSLQGRGLRTPQGEAGPDFPGPETDRPAVASAAALPDTDATDDVLRVWTGVNLSARILTLFDVSGSMAAQVPGTSRSRAQVAAETAKQGLGLFKPTTDMGLWAFSSNLDGDRDYRELAPIEPLSTGRDQLVGLMDQAVSLVGGRTNLYDTLLAAYHTVQQGWDAARLNVVVVLTDGRDDDVSGISRQQLLDELTKLQDPKRPTRIIFVGLGPDVDAAELDQIAAVTGGRAFTTANPAGIRDVFAQALAALTHP